MLLQVIKKSADTLMNELQPLAFEKDKFVIQEKSDHIRILVHKICDAMVLSRNIIIKRCCTNKNLLTETVMEEIEMFVFEKNPICLTNSFF